MIATVWMVGVVALGLIAGRFWPFAPFANVDTWVMGGLCALLVLVGLQLGRSKTAWQTVRQQGFYILLLPLAVLVGSIGGSVLAGLAISMSPIPAGAVGAGVGWYSLSATIISAADAQLGVVAFLSNILREIIAIVLVPLLSKTLGPWPAISTAGATAMDTVLPVIAHSAGSESAAVAFISGVLLSLSVPLVVPVLLGFL